jgi:hypothetical protein
MKKLLALLIISCFLSAISVAQNSLPGLDKSPMDMSYYPVNYPSLKVQGKPIAPLIARVIYSRPQKNGRAIFDSLVEYGKVWRVGANEATEIEFFQPVMISGKQIDKGRYTLYAIPNSTTWTIIINKETDTWGAYGYDEKKDLLRVDVPVQKQTTSTEALVMVFEKSDTGANLVIVWDKVKVALPIEF